MLKIKYTHICNIYKIADVADIGVVGCNFIFITSRLIDFQLVLAGPLNQLIASACAGMLVLVFHCYRMCVCVCVEWMSLP